MKVTTGSVFDILTRLRAYFQRGNALRQYASEMPFRSELYNSDQLDRHGKIVASSHKLLNKPSSDQLIKRLDSNETTLLEVRNLLVESIRSGKNITPGAEWLLDNFYLIEEQVVIARKHLPKGYSEGLPCLASGASAGMPRVYDIVLEIISHSDGRVDAKGLSSFIANYQKQTVLTIGELWAIPIMLRLAVIENLRRVAGKMALEMIDQNMADYWADKMMLVVKEEPGNLILTIADMARSLPVLDSPFVAAFTRKLQGKGPSLALPLTWMEQQLSGQGINSNDLVRQENQKQATDQVSVRNSIGTLRFIGATDWRIFVENLSQVEFILKQDTSGEYSLMDFTTRDRYRHVVERIAHAANISETEVAQKALDLTKKANEDINVNSKWLHIGYYLIDKGVIELETAVKCQFGILESISRKINRMPVFIYIISIVILTIIFSAGMFHLSYINGIVLWWQLLIAGLLFISCSSQLAISMVNWLATLFVKPKLLPRLNFSKGIPSEYRTLIIVPAMLSDVKSIDELLEALEIRYLANIGENLHFGLLTDFLDADKETMPGDEDMVLQAKAGIQALNRKYPLVNEDVFFLFHRPRTWNKQEKKWMGYERKRGKLAALHTFLRGKREGLFSEVVGNTAVLHSIKYIITLDADTQLPREAVWKFVATMAHPLNRPIYDFQKKRVTEGYAILQPRVATALPKQTSSLYLRMQGDVAGIDPYTRVSSDVYQDLFGEGSFIGKGIYDVEVFEQAVEHAFQENRILSHDLLEGCYARSGLLSDVFLYEENPSQYLTTIKRHSRWIRGDWQVGAWMLPVITDSEGKLTKNKLSVLSRWKISDNLRRSLLPSSLLTLLIAGWFFLPFPWVWTLIVTVILMLPTVAMAAWNLIHKPRDITLQAHIAEIWIFLRDNIIRFIFSMAVLPYEAYRFSHAVLLTNWRLIVSKRKMLEWTPSAIQVSANTYLSVYANMWVVPFFSVLVTGFLVYFSSTSILVAFPFLVLWILSPAMAFRLSMPEKKETNKLSIDQAQFLNQSARKTWAYFEDFVTVADNWLPPDNFQEQPFAVIAHRTSPTNIGLSLLSNLVAYDFGYISNSVLLERCEKTAASMKKLERYNGHFLNWYDTLTLQPLNPRYVSTVDSGNLMGHTLTLRQGLLTLPYEPILNPKLFEGLKATIPILAATKKGYSSILISQFGAELVIQEHEVASLSKQYLKLVRLNDICDYLKKPTISENDLWFQWANRLYHQVNNSIEDLKFHAPWIELLPIPSQFPLLNSLDEIPSWSSILHMSFTHLPIVEKYLAQSTSQDERNWLINLETALRLAISRSGEKMKSVTELADECNQFCEVNYDFLFDKSTNLLRIGYNVDDQRRDDSFYDLLASEARLGIFVAIAQGKLPQESWFALGRLLTNSGGDPILLSWSGSMFEYLMPQLVMPIYENTLLFQTSKATVKRQIEYADQKEVPWGISESAYNTVDTNMNYQYRAFGIPGLGLMRGLEEDIVIAPYASMLALMVAPVKSCNNLMELSDSGFIGQYGFYEAIDYTASRQPRGKKFSVIHSYMVHHQGMGFLSMAYQLLNKPMQRRFSLELRFQATLLLLQEKIPRATLFYAHTPDLIEKPKLAANIQLRDINTPHTLVPEIQLLSNGRYQVMVNNSGGGYSRWEDIAITRWREDATIDDKGIFCYIKDVSTGKFWSNTYQPTLHPPKGYQAIFSQGHIEFKRSDYGIDTKTEIVISPEDDAELRRIRITNKTGLVKTIEVTSYAEIVLASQSSDEAHPAFSNLFVETIIAPEHKAIFSTRRPRSEEEQPPWAFHLMDAYGVKVEAISFESDRMAFIGRGRDLTNPSALDNELLKGGQGAVLDPIFSIRYRLTIKPNQVATIDLIYGVAETKAACENLLHKYRDSHLKNRAFELAWTHSQVLLRQINATEADSQLYDRLASAIIYAQPYLRAKSTVVKGNFRGQSGLWSHSVSGDLPIVVLQIYNAESMELVRQMVQAHAYWQLKGLSVDLIIWNEVYGSYRQFLHDEIPGLLSMDKMNHKTYSPPGKIFIKTADQLSQEDKVLFESLARVIINDNNGSLQDQVNRHHSEKMLPALLEIKSSRQAYSNEVPELESDLLFDNGTGGFYSSGNEYKMIIRKPVTTPAPWVNVIANKNFGTVLSESGAGYTWALNAHEYRITPWSNDPVSDRAGEAFYIRDEDSGKYWSPSSFPTAGNTPYLVTHGFGYSKFKHLEEGISSEMTVFVDKDMPVKFVVLSLQNLSGFDKKLSATGYLEMILGDIRSKTNMHIFSEVDADNGSLYFRNRYNTAFAERVTVFKVSGTGFSYTSDRNEFIGRNRNLSMPSALGRKKLSGRTGAVMDPCGALQVKFDLADSERKEVIFMIGNERNLPEAKKLIAAFTDPISVSQSLERILDYWKNVNETITIKTPDKALDLLANGWLTYQTLSCRFLARSGFYQSGGAFGFRDQLQDVLALLHSQPEMARAHILLCASRQFTEGDVQHWWHPPEGRGVRTRCSDDLLWLPYAVADYVKVTGDETILMENVSFLTGRVLHPDEDSFYDLPAISYNTATLYDHCVLAIQRSFHFGEHALPLIGSGDWNDGMDKVGNKGKGESVWLAFFLYHILQHFIPIAERKADSDFALTCRNHALSLQTAIELNGWDGEWYLRAFFDDGSALGSKDNLECRIDAIAQSWSVLSGAAKKERQDMAMTSLYSHLVKKDLRLIQLLDPAFNSVGINPGYIKGYLPGVRENGGQYSHAAIWAIMAFAAKEDREKTWELFQLINPILHADSAEAVATYKVEPYVMAADVYANEKHKGRGGWTWYTGSAGWMYQLIIKYIIGLRREADTLVFNPCFPLEWPFVEIDYRYKNTLYKIKIFQSSSIMESYILSDQIKVAGNRLELIEESTTKEIIVYIAVV